MIKILFSPCPKCEIGLMEYVKIQAMDLDKGRIETKIFFSCTMCAYDDKIYQSRMEALRN